MPQSDLIFRTPVTFFRVEPTLLELPQLNPSTVNFVVLTSAKADGTRMRRSTTAARADHRVRFSWCMTRASGSEMVEGSVAE